MFSENLQKLADVHRGVCSSERTSLEEQHLFLISPSRSAACSKVSRCIPKHSACILPSQAVVFHQKDFHHITTGSGFSCAIIRSYRLGLSSIQLLIVLHSFQSFAAGCRCCVGASAQLHDAQRRWIQASRSAARRTSVPSALGNPCTAGSACNASIRSAGPGRRVVLQQRATLHHE